MIPTMSGVPRLKFSASTVNVVCDGNSLTAGIGGGPYPAFLASLAPLNGVVSVTNCGVNGQTIEQMRSSAADVDGAWVAGRTNILIVWPATNSLAGGGDTPQQAYSALAGYIADRLAVHPWIVVVITEIPRQLASSQADTDALNAKLDAYNALVRAGYRSIGAKALVDVRQAGSPFAFSDYLYATFEASASAGYWAAVPGTDPTSQHTHLSNTGYMWVARAVAFAMSRLHRR